MKKFLMILVAGIIFVFTPVVLAADFSDLGKEHWAYPAVTEMTLRGILNGYPDNTFQPNKPITRAEFAKILVTSLKLDVISNTEFSDVSQQHWAYDYIKIASNYLPGDVTQDNSFYFPNQTVSREDMAFAIVGAMGLENTNVNLEVLNRFTDSNSISDNRKRYVAIAVENDILHGNEDGTFASKGNLTRAEVSQLMLNVLKKKQVAVYLPSVTANSIKELNNLEEYRELFVLNRDLEEDEELKVVFSVRGELIQDSVKEKYFKNIDMTTSVSDKVVSARISDIWEFAKSKGIFAQNAEIECNLLKNHVVVASDVIRTRLTEPYLVKGIVADKGISSKLSGFNYVLIVGEEYDTKLDISDIEIGEKIYFYVSGEDEIQSKMIDGKIERCY